MKNKVTIIDTNYPINTRNIRLKNLFSLSKTSCDTSVITWDRFSTSDESNSNMYLYKKKSLPGRKFKKFFYFSFFGFFVLKKLFKIQPDYIIASHFDSLIIAVFYKIYNRKVSVIYDCLDMPQSISKSIQILFHYLEKVLIKKFVDHTFLASRFFKPFYKEHKNIHVVENLPSAEISNLSRLDCVSTNILNFNFDLVDSKSIAWVGVVRYPIVLMNMIDASIKLNYKVYIFGTGPSEEFLINYVNSKNLSDSVFFFGKFDFIDLPYIYSVSDFIWAAYPTSSFNAKYAISNKYYECNYFGVVPLISKNTIMAEYLSENNASFICFDELDVIDIVSNINNYKSSMFVRYENILFFDEYSSVIDLILEG